MAPGPRALRSAGGRACRVPAVRRSGCARWSARCRAPRPAGPPSRPRPAIPARDRRSRRRVRTVPSPAPCAAGRCSSSAARWLTRRARWLSAAIISTIWRRRATRSASSRVISSGSCAQLRLGRLGKMRDHRGIDRIGLGALAERLGEGAHLRRIDHHHRQACAGQARRDHRLEAAGRLDRHQRRRASPSAVRSARRSPHPLRPTAKLSPLGRTATSSRSFDTSMPT